MGFEVKRFCSEVNAEFICPICKNVLENAVRISSCEHMFCRACINTWMIHTRFGSPTCPVDRKRILLHQLIAPDRTVISILNQLKIKCKFESYGCKHVGSLENIDNHSKNCDYNPYKKRPCKAGCGKLINRAEKAIHRCVKMLEIEIGDMKKKIENQKRLVLESEATKQELTIKNNELLKRLESTVKKQEKSILNLRIEAEKSKKLVNEYQETIQLLIEKNTELERKNKHQDKIIDNLKRELEKKV